MPLALVKTGTYTQRMALSSRAARVVLAFCVAAGTLAAPDALVAQTPQRAVYVSVTDPAGNPVPGLGPSDFIVREDNVSREVLSVAPVDEPMQLAVLLDISQAAEAFVRDYRNALTAFITAVTNDTTPKGKHQIALVGIAGRPTILRDYSSDPTPLLKSAQSVFSMPDTGTYLLDGIIETSQGIAKREATRPVIVAIITEGPELSNRPYDLVLQTLTASGAALHVVKVGSPRNNSYDRAMVIDQGTRTSGGRNEDLLASTALPNMMKKLAADLTHQYRVTYARPQTLIQPETVTVAAAKPGLTARGTAVRPERPQPRR